MQDEEKIATMDQSCTSLHENDDMGDGSVGHASVHSARSAMARDLAARENRAVCVLRVLVPLALVAAATGVSVWVFLSNTRNEQDDFRAAFTAHANQVKEAFSDAVERKLVSIGSLSNAITSYAQDTSSKFPFVTVSDFALRGSDARILGDAFLIHWCPMVTEANRLAWENYTLQNRFKINEAHEQDKKFTRQQDEFFDATVLDESNQEEETGGDAKSGHGGTLQEQNNSSNPTLRIDEDANLVLDGSGFRPRIWNPLKNRTAEPEGSGPYWPSWQRTPVNKGRQQLINLNFASAKVFQGVLPVFKTDPKVVINRISVPLPSFHKQVTGNIRASQYRNHVVEYLQDPLSYMSYPVFDSFNISTRQLAGALISNLYWRLHFKDVLPPDAKGIICVLQNSFNQTFSYRIDGYDVTVLGPEDHHDPKYDDMMVFQDVTSFVKSRAGVETRAYLTVPLHETFGRYTLKVYPSQITENEYTSQKPALFATIVALVFLVTALVFVLFDFWVARRQQIVKDKAINSGLIVDSMFPKQVQDRLFSNESLHLQECSPQKKEPKTWDLKKKMARAPSLADIPSEEIAKKQIADFFPESTIMFADLAGFTAWSGSRQPCEVFDLLESLYNGFDKIAMRRKVFKVETIGDCYLAVCGVPEPNPKHAVAMARFASDCIDRLNSTVQKLSSRLGADTKELRLRVGLHSGPVTAGVLRGQKARFQLFGDSVNTASRIETTGQPGRIHASQSTAEQLIAWKKGFWLEVRPDKVVAKGKGELTTYWITTKGNSTSSNEQCECNSSINSGILDFAEDSSQPQSSTFFELSGTTVGSHMSQTSFTGGNGPPTNIDIDV